MGHREAKEIAKTITNKQLFDMFEAAKKGIKHWTKRSSCNPTMSKGTAWNILAKNFNIEKDYHFLAKKNMIWEFGDFLPAELKPIKVKRKLPAIVHQNPIF